MKLDFKRVTLQLSHPWTIARSKATKTAEVVVVQLTSADGMIGLGEAAPTPRYKESPGSVEAFLRKVDARGLSFKDVEGSMAYLETISAHDMSAKCALNIALLDGAARREKLPIYDYLGLGFQEGRHVTSFTIGIDQPEVIRKKVLDAERYPVLKIKLGVAEDKQNLAALREAAPTKQLRVDANEGWKTKEQALEMIEWLAQQGNIQFVEQPLSASAPAKDWTWLKERSPLPIFADESFHHAGEIARAPECFHGINVKLIKTGGISGALEALQAARKAKLKTMIGCMIETSILISAAAHLAELCDYLDLDGNVLISNDPYAGATSENGLFSFASAPEKLGLCAARRDSNTVSL